MMPQSSFSLGLKEQILRNAIFARCHQAGSLATRDMKLFAQFSDIWVFPKIGVPQNGWFIMENPI